MRSLGLEETDDFIDELLNRPLRIVYQDENYVAVFKPAGLIVHRSPSTLANEPVLLQSLRDQLKRHVFPVHRLDRPTAGLILLALNARAAAKMVDLFTRRMVAKYYQALVVGLAPDQASIVTPLTTQLDDDWASVGPSARLGPARLGPSTGVTQEAETNFITLSRHCAPRAHASSDTDRFSLLEVRPSTGRSHQIRRHLTEIGHPILGDHRHGDPFKNELVRAATGVPRMLLTSMRLDFRHPYSDEMQSILVDQGSQFEQVMDWLEPYGKLKTQSDW
jgi:tRNA pseudouridine65 synthase